MKTYQLSVPIYVELTTEAENVEDAVKQFLDGKYKFYREASINYDETEWKDPIKFAIKALYGDESFICEPGIIVDGDCCESLAEAIEYEKKKQNQ